MFCFCQRIASAYMYTLTQLVNILTNTLGKAREREGEGEREREIEITLNSILILRLAVELECLVTFIQLVLSMV